MSPTAVNGLSPRVPAEAAASVLSPAGLSPRPRLREEEGSPLQKPASGPAQNAPPPETPPPPAPSCEQLWGCSPSAFPPEFRPLGSPSTSLAPAAHGEPGLRGEGSWRRRRPGGRTWSAPGPATARKGKSGRSWPQVGIKFAPFPRRFAACPRLS